MLKNTIKLVVTLIFLISISGCSTAEDVSPEIKGKFIIDSFRDLKEPWGIYIWEKGKIEKFKYYRAISPLWSNDGESIACVKDSQIRIIDKEGNLLETFPETKGAIKLTWSPDNNLFAYTSQSADRETDLLFLYNIETGEKRKLIDYKNKYNIFQVSFSPKGDKILFTKIDSRDIKNGGVYYYDLKNSSVKLVTHQGRSPSWYPDGRHIFIETNRKEDWSMINDKLGVFMKINLETGEKTTLREIDSFIKDIRVSRDGKYFYYSKPYGDGGYIIVVSPIDNPDIEIPVTKAIYLNSSNGHSQDLESDWYQDK